MKKRIDLSDFSLLVVDECHRSVKKYAYPFVTREYIERSKYPRILGLTASPGSDTGKIEEIKSNLYADRVEIRTEDDPDVKPYVKEIEIEYIRLSFDNELSSVHSKIKKVLNDRIKKLNQRYRIRTKTEIILLQKKLNRLLKLERNPQYFYYLSLIAEIIKIWHLLELYETQSIMASKKFLDRIRKESSKAAKRILSDKDMRDVIFSLDKFSSEKKEHPKISTLTKEVEKYSSKGKKIIIFSHYRDNIDLIYNKLREIKGCRPVKLIGQAGESGLKQKQQISIIRDYESGVYNCLIASSIGEEGLHLGSADVAIFYDSVASEIRTIQRRGRVGRTKIGKVIFLLTRNTRDMSNFYIERRKEKKMKEILKEMKNDIVGKDQYSIKRFLRKV